jgi:DedD protein
VGTIIVSAAIVIFLPDILDGEKQSYQADFDKISAAPAFEKKQVNRTFPQEKLTRLPKQKLSEDPAIDDDVQLDITKKNKIDSLPTNQGDVKIAVLIKDKLVDTKKEPLKSNDIKESISSNAVQSKGVSQLPEKAVLTRAWVIHLGSFRHKQNVKELLGKLKANGYNAYTKPIKTKNGTLTKVFVGPELIKSSLDKKLSKLKTLTNVQGKVARYEANN